jgi:choline kinase
MRTKVIVLAAGKGERLYPLTRNTPKSLLHVGEGLTLLESQLHSIAGAGVRDVVIVGGYRVAQIEAKLESYRRESDVNISVVFNPFYDVSNNLVSLWFAKHEMRHDADAIVIVNGDDLFQASVLEGLLAVPQEREICVVISRKSKYDEDDMKVSIVDDRIRRISKKIPAEEASGESIGMIRVVGNATRLLVTRLDTMLRDETNRSVFWLEAFNELIAEGWPVWFHDVPSKDWAEMDFHPDLDLIREKLRSSADWLKSER